MKKIISLFQRNYDGDRLVRDEVVPGAEWVLAGEGIATRKWNGTSCLFKDGQWFKRYDAKKGKTPPLDFVPEEAADPKTGHWPGWVPVKPEKKWHNEAIKLGMATTGEMAGSRYKMVPFEDGQTYELIGPKIQANPEKALTHIMVKHGAFELQLPDRSFKSIYEFLSMNDIEGIVWHHPDGRMVKIKAKDFGLTRK